MRAAQLIGPGRFAVVDAPEPSLAAGEVLVRTHAASICGSDLHSVFGGMHRGAYPAPIGYPGHEAVGTVVASRSARVGVGDAVLTVPLPADGRCYAELQAIGDAFVVPLPPDGDLDRLLLAQQLGTTLYAFRHYWHDGDDAARRTAAVLGAGSGGLFFCQLARRAGFSSVIVGDRDTTRLRVAGDLGADVLIEMSTESFSEAVLDATGGDGADLVIEAAGPDDCRTACVEAARLRGRIGFYGLPEHAGLVPFPLDTAFRKGVTITMTVGAQREPGLRAFRDSVELITSGEIDVGYLLEPRFELDRFQDAMDAARDHAGVKVSVGLAPGHATA